MKIRLDRLQKVVDANKRRKNDKFDKFDMSKVQHACGTPACMLGGYVLLSNQRTFKMARARKDWDGNTTGSSRLIDNKTGYIHWFNDDVVLAHFGLNEEQFERLFGPQRRTRKEMIRKFEKFIKEHSK